VVTGTRGTTVGGLAECGGKAKNSGFSSLDIRTYIPPTCGPLRNFLVHFGVPKCPKTAQKTYVLVAPDHFFLEDWLNDMVRGLFSSLNIGTYILPTCGPLCTFLGQFGGAQMPQKLHKKTNFGLFHTIFPTRTGLMIWLGP
jgi:hypothetical protein